MKYFKIMEDAATLGEYADRTQIHNLINIAVSTIKQTLREDRGLRYNILLTSVNECNAEINRCMVAACDEAINHLIGTNYQENIDKYVSIRSRYT